MKELKFIQAVSEHDLEKVFSIRKRVFVKEQNCPPELEWENEDVSVHFLALLDGVACGACRWRKTDLGYKLERFSVLKEFRGFGVGKFLIANILKQLPSDATYIYLNAQVDVVSMYQKFGFVSQGEQFEEAGIQHYKMVKKDL